MALIDIVKFDLFDLIVSKTFTDEQKGEYSYEYLLAYAGYISEQVADRLTDADEVEMSKLLVDPGITPEAIENFYRQRISNFDALFLAGSLLFKKNFLLDYYRRMLEGATKQKDLSVSFWVKIITASEEDNWKMVARHIQQIEDLYVTPPALVAAHS